MEYRFAGCLLDDAQRRLTRDGENVAVEPQVFDLLLLLARNRDRVVSKDEIVAIVWNGRIVSESAISARIASARKAVGDDGKRQAVIRTVARRGLQMVADVETVAAQASAVNMQDEVQRIRYVQLPSGHSMAYAILGQGPPVFMVPHGRSDLEGEWQLAFERDRFRMLAQRNTLIRFDMVGSGQSDRSTDRASIAHQGEDITHLADLLGLERFGLCSLSGGCNAAIHCAAHHPDRVTRLAMTGAYAEGRLVRDTGGETADDPLRSLIAQTDAPQYSTFFEAAMLTYQPEGPLDHIKAFASVIQNAATREYELLVRDTINHHSNMDLLDRITCPTLILQSRHDAVHPLSEARKLATHIPNAELVVLESANHIPWPGNTCFDSYVRTLSDFLAKSGGI